MKKIVAVFAIFLSMSVSAQIYSDVPYLQDYADKYELPEDLSDNDLLQVRSDRNKFINILSSENLLQPWEKTIRKDFRYMPLLDMNLLSIESYKDQFVFLTDKAVFSNAFAGKFYVYHGLENPSHFAMAHNFTTLVAGDDKLVLVQNGDIVWSESLAGSNLVKIKFDETGKRFLILTSDAVYQLQCPDKKLSKVFESDDLTALTVMNDKIVIGTEDGVLTLDPNSFEASKINKNAFN